MDSRTILAVVLVGVVWLSWQSYLNKKYPNMQNQQVENIQPSANTPAANNPTSIDETAAATQATSLNKAAVVETAPAVAVAEQLLDYENDVIKLQISNQGMAVKNFSLKKYTERDGKPISFNIEGTGNFETLIGNRSVFFEIQKKSVNEFVGTYKDSNLSLTKKITINNYSIDTEVLVDTLNSAVLPEIKTSINDVRRVKGESHFWAPSLETQSLFVVHPEGDTEASFYVGDKEVNVSQPRMNVTSISSHYFASAIVDKSELLPDFNINHRPTDVAVNGNVVYKPSNEVKNLKLNYLAFIGPKDVGLLSTVDANLVKIVSFGFFSSIAKPMLVVMKWFFAVTGNWGIAIILLTLLVRMIVMPLHIMSFRSMKTMQKIQPMIQTLREKYANDSVALNREMMDLMKRNKVNPLSGCLPMLLQIPVFFALYRVFGQSIELYKSPFIFWIKDLSMMDPYFVLPVLMAIVMYLQQKMTPSNMDPAQAKVMQFLPIIFSFMMLSLPSALTLYIFVSTLFGIIQQYFFLKDKQSLAANEAKV